jgi:ABC-type Fe3+-hydroxamate transport system substrate-binding protein
VGPRRIVSLCPSITETLHALGVWDRVVGRTDYCVHPAGLVDDVGSVGGTKRVKQERLLALAPDLVLANREENRKEDVEAIRNAGVPVHVSFPKTVSDAADVVEEFGRLLGAEERAAEIGREVRAAASAPGDPVTCVYVIWRKPWMVATEACFIGDVLRSAGFLNLVPAGDTAYPTLDSDKFARVARAADAVLLSSEPFPFVAKHVPDVPTSPERVHLVDGELLSWHGVRTVRGVRYAADLAARIRAQRG